MEITCNKKHEIHQKRGEKMAQFVEQLYIDNILIQSGILV